MPLLSYNQAAREIQSVIETLKTEGVAPPQELISLASASGRVLAEPICADRDQPPFPRATRDGFAVRAAEANTHQFLRLTGQIRAGQQNDQVIPPGEAWEIMTGAAVPPGADCVFMIEHSEITDSEITGTANDGQKSVRLEPPRTLTAGENIVPRGAEAHASDLVIPAGIRLTPAHIALAAQCGCAHLRVFRQPRVAILATGDELVPVEATPAPHQIRNSNSPMLAALVRASGGDPWLLSTASDTSEALNQALDKAKDADFLLISGGISAGRFDLVDQALIQAGASFLFRGVAIQPGKPVAFGQLPGANGKTIPVFALPGNPISSAVTFRLFAARLLAALSGETDPHPHFALALLSADWTGKPGLTRFLPAICDFGAHGGMEPVVRPVSWQGSGDLAAFARSNCCLVIPADAEVISAGTAVQILLTSSRIT
jgi:molybdopterin molybdotransferase